MKITSNKLVSENSSEVIIQETTPNKEGVIDPRFIIIHYTGGQSAETSVEWFKNRDSKTSSHLVIGRDGKIFQLVDFNKKAYHAGKSKWANVEGFNAHSIGIELDNPGRLTKVGDKYVSWFKKEYPRDNVVEATHKHEEIPSFWCEFTEKQMAACLQVCKVLMNQYRIQDILGHDDIAPFRKCDPGPLFPMENFRGKLLGRQDDTTDIYEVNTNKTNIRKGAGTQFEPYGKLNKGTKVEFIKSNNSWFYVFVIDKPDVNEDVLYGWVHNSLLTKVDS